jgi:putative hydrolase of the HAD superfamily
MEHNKKRKKDRVKALIFDIGGVVIYYDNMITARKMSKLINVSAKKIFNILDNSKTKFAYSYELGDPPSVYWAIMAKKLGVKKIDSKKLGRLWTTIFWPNKRLISLVKKLKKNYKTGLISNIGRLHENYLSRKYKLRNLFSVRVFSYEVKSRKPGPRIFRVILKKLKAKPEEVIFVDDRIENVRGARKLGIRGICFKNNEQFFEELKNIGVK